MTDHQVLPSKPAGRGSASAPDEAALRTLLRGAAFAPRFAGGAEGRPDTAAMRPDTAEERRRTAPGHCRVALFYED
ncbi:hypothetical protein [Kitasatospora camelliae]|uniref:Uncharacterized protein n=1 Tax=Kitasatospora camelliae TaxID=3156397 RepID=A0AAU8JPY9_9ACTN